MSIPDNPGPDDEMFKSMRDQLKDIEVPDDDRTNVQNLSDMALADALGKVRLELLSMGEMMNVKSAKGRELHSRRTALLIEMNKRHPSP